MSLTLCVLIIVNVVLATAVAVYLGDRLNRLECIILALNEAQSAELQAAVSQIGTDLDELATRLENSVVSDDETVTAVIAALRGQSERIDSIAPNDEAEPPPAPVV